MAFQENQFRVCVEFLRSAQSGRGRVIRLNHGPNAVPPQLQGRLHPGYWHAFIEDAGHLSLQHPYVATASAKQMCSWAACFGLGAVVGLFCMNPDAGDYGVWEAQCRQLVDRWAPGFAQAGCTLTLQRHRDYWLQVDIDASFPVGQPVAPPLPTVPLGDWQAKPQAGQPTVPPPQGAAATPAQLAPPAQPTPPALDAGAGKPDSSAAV